MSQPLDISVIVPAYGTARAALRSLRSYLRYGPEVREIIIISCGIDSEEEHKLRGFADLHETMRVVSPTPTLTIVEGYNSAARKAKGKYLLFFDHIELRAEARGLIERMYSTAQQARVGMVGCLILRPDNKTIQQAGILLQPGGLSTSLYTGKKMARAIRHYGRQTFLYDIRRSRAVSAVSDIGLVARTAFTRTTGFNTSFAPAEAWTDLCLRFNAAWRQTWYVGGGHVVSQHVQASAHQLSFDEAVAFYRSLYPAYDLAIGDPHSSKLTAPKD